MICSNWSPEPQPWTSVLELWITLYNCRGLYEYIVSYEQLIRGLEVHSTANEVQIRWLAKESKLLRLKLNRP
jgi:hypothetical protein